MGISTKKTKTTTNQNTTADVTPTNPEWVTNGISGLAGKIGDTFKNLDPASLVAGADPLQTQAGVGAAGLTSSPNYGQASDILRGVAGAGPSTVQAGDIQGGIAGFLNPYLKDTVDTSLADFDYGAGQQTGQANLDLANDTTFGGSGGALYKSALGGELARGRGTLAAGLRSDAYDRASALAAQQAGLNQQASQSNASLMEQALARQMGAGTSLADVGTATGANDRANIGAQASIGDMLRQIADARAKAPVTALGAESDLYGKLPLDLFKGQNATGSLSGTNTTKQSGAGLTDWLNFFAQNAQAAAAAGGG